MFCGSTSCGYTATTPYSSLFYKSMHPTPHNVHYVVVTFKNPVLWAIDGDETWLLNPARRYVMNSDMLDGLAAHIDTVSDLRPSAKYVPLRRGENILGKRVLVDRYRHRGIGDLLFMTGPLAWLHHVTGGRVTLDVYTLVERGAVLADNPHISSRTPLNGPIHYDDFGNYAAQWMVEVATEFDESADQINVYDALYRSMDVDPSTVDDRFKRPHASLNMADAQALDAFYWRIMQTHRCDLRATPYYVVAPLSHASLRSVPYAVWLGVIQKMAAKHPVVVLGAPRTGYTPDAGSLTFSQFNQELDKLRSSGAAVFNCIGITPLRLSMAVVASAKAFTGLDSGLLYVAQAFRTPAVSVWGTHNPHTRLGYDKTYMDGAIWRQEQCPQSPCYAYSRFPQHKCVYGASQNVCEVLKVTPDEIVSKLLKIS